MKFVHKATGVEVKKGDTLNGRDGSTMIATGGGCERGIHVTEYEEQSFLHAQCFDASVYDCAPIKDS